MAVDVVAARVQQWQTRLIDMSRRNRLLAFRPTASSTLRLTQPDPGALFDLLVRRERGIDFYDPRPDNEVTDFDDEGLASADGERIGTLVPPSASPFRSPRATELVAELEPRRLTAVLNRMRLRAQTSVDEQGINTLFVAFGLVEWKERPDVEETLRSPLLLVPVTLRRNGSQAPYRLEPLDEDVVLNPTLIEKLRRDFGHEVDTGTVDFEEQTLQQILSATAGWLPKRMQPRILAEAYLGFFSFAKLSLYKDLEANVEVATSHPLIRTLAGVATELPEAEGGIPSDAELDEAVPPQAAHHVLDADPSQLRAIEAAKRGVSFVMQGPPGTGKSQTIANIIAEIVFAGKTVLFVSEKEAARDVVYARLAKVGLDGCCLRLDAKTPKREVVADLGRVWQAAESDGGAGLSEHELQRLAEQRRELDGFARALREPVSGLGVSTFLIHARLAQLMSAPDVRFAFADVFSLNQATMRRIEQLANRLTDLHPVLLGFNSHPWHGCSVAEYTLDRRTEIVGHLGALATGCAGAMALAKSLAARLGTTPAERLVEFDALQRLAEHAATTPYPPASWYLPGVPARRRDLATRWLAEHERYRTARQHILERYDTGIFALDLSTCAEAVTTNATPALDRIVVNGLEAADQAETDRLPLGAALAGAQATLAAYSEAVAELVAAATLPSVTTTAAADQLCRLLELALLDPAPEPAWLEPEAFARTDALLEQATKKARDLAAKADLTAAFETDLFELAPEMAGRFARDYGTFLRYVRPDYWRDLRHLKRLAKPGTSVGYPEAAATLVSARRACEAESFFADQADALRAALGRRSRGPGSDWDSLSSALATARALLDNLNHDTPPAGLLHVLAADAPARRSLRERLRQVQLLRTRLDIALSELGRFVRLSPPLEDEPMSATVTDLAKLHARLQAFWAAVAAVRAAQRNELSDRVVTVATLAEDIATARQVMGYEADLTQAAPDLQDALGDLFDGLATDWREVSSAAGWTEALLTQFSPQLPPAGVIAVTAEGADPMGARAVADDVSQLNVTVDHLLQELTYLDELFPATAPARGGLDPRRAPLKLVADWAQVRLDSLDELERWLDFRDLRRECDEEGLGDLIRALMTEQPPVDRWLDLVRRRIYRLWLDERYRQEPRLARFRTAEHERLITDFRRLDESSIQAASGRIRRQLLSQRPARHTSAARGAQSQPAILQRELLKKRHKPLRRLFTEIPTLLVSLKPCLMLSPLAVSQFLEAGRFAFDLVIFDEASQVLPEDAVGAILRGKQLIVAGDNKQLPPTTFFDRVDDGDGDDDAADSAASAVAPPVADLPGELAEASVAASSPVAPVLQPIRREVVLESVLDECASRGLEPFPLRWHYRSRHESLIAFSNQYFYDDRLLTFPGANFDHPLMGVKFVYVPDGVYKPGRTSDAGMNRVEAKRIAELVIAHAEASPERSLGVIAFSQRQRDAILGELDGVRRLRRDLDAFFDEARPERFFVKSLEHVQGDERDMIVLGVGYAKDLTGRLSHNFGPLNREGGERRLNVAVTRARLRLQLVSSIQAEDIDPTRTTSRGAQLLRAYLDYARRGQEALEIGLQEVGGTADSIFETAVADALRAQGLQVRQQIGCAGYRVDLGVVDPARPGRYLLGVECDGATYHSSMVARERDRLRQQILEGLGWRIHRIWSRDWVIDPSRELDKVLRAVEAARADTTGLEAAKSTLDDRLPAHLPNEPSSDLPVASQYNRSADEPTPIRPVVVAAPAAWPPFPLTPLAPQGRPDDFLSVATSRLLTLIERCVEVQGPVAAKQVMRQVAAVWRIERVGSRIEARLAEAIRVGHQSRFLHQPDDFLWPTKLKEAPVRGPSADGATRPIEFVCDAELMAALRLVTTELFAVERDGLIVETARRFGYLRTGAHVRGRLLNALDQLAAQGILRVSGEQVALSRSQSDRRQA